MIQLRFSDIPGNCRADELARPGMLLPELSSNEFVMPFALVKLNIEQKFFRNANLFQVNQESCSTARLTWPLMNRRHTNQLLSLDCDVISTTVVVLTAHCVIGRHAVRIKLHLTTSAVNAALLRKRRLLSSFSVNTRLLLDVDIGYLAPHFFSV